MLRFILLLVLVFFAASSSVFADQDIPGDASHCDPNGLKSAYIECIDSARAEAINHLRSMREETPPLGPRQTQEDEISFTEYQTWEVSEDGTQERAQYVVNSVNFAERTVVERRSSDGQESLPKKRFFPGPESEEISNWNFRFSIDSGLIPPIHVPYRPVLCEVSKSTETWIKSNKGDLLRVRIEVSRTTDYSPLLNYGNRCTYRAIRLDTSNLPTLDRTHFLPPINSPSGRWHKIEDRWCSKIPNGRSYGGTIRVLDEIVKVVYTRRDGYSGGRCRIRVDEIIGYEESNGNLYSYSGKDTKLDRIESDPGREGCFTKIYKYKGGLESFRTICR